MYVNAYIEESENKVTTLPSEAIVSFDDKDYIFAFEKEKEEDGKPFTEYRMVEVKRGASGSGYTEIKLPEGFNIEIYASNDSNARSMVLSETGILFVGSRSSGNVYAMVDNDQDYKVDEVLTIASGLDMPNGVDIKDGDLYVAEVSRIIKFDDIENNYRNNPTYSVVRDDFPTDRSHGWKFIKFGPDGKLYVPIGAPCNICLKENVDARYASITRMNADGSEFEVFAKGIRNTVGFDWHPTTNELWFTDNGRDNLGDNIPPDE
jgi:glucose/arabinose dehydrogenase